LFSSLETAALFPITGIQIALNICVALICGFAISLLYRHTYRGPGYSVAFVNTILLLTMITSMVIMTIGSNLARAFGLVGAMSIIRFRTAVKDTQDIVYIFFALAVGMAAGGGYYNIAFMGTAIIGVVIYLSSLTTGSVLQKEEYLLQVSCQMNGDDTPPHVSLLKRYCRSHHVINTRALGDEGDRLEIAYYVKLRDKGSSDRFVRELRQTKGVSHVNLYFDEERF
jgi:uncharacterized membrane protein YhiD involved in acid resistance